VTTYRLYEVYNDPDEPVASIWMQKGRVKCDNPYYDHLLDSICVYNMTRKDGEKFFNVLPSYFRSGYVALRQANAE